MIRVSWEISWISSVAVITARLSCGHRFDITHVYPLIRYQSSYIVDKP